ncbi:MAG TPA: ABC transporter substrate-binding protein [Candidatus Corynebacterium gallistercoris]|uniref:ABC transporter substrate-binding protein n=1 Tax=Candidatus Corynebacterium gallistercoris TaxID=2838530 RepID=A0A9D1UPU3_9CORY|nr:ABC transporter substrate-binding protein [Candidatus Corynebacterium gallistercoris]
MAGCQAQDPPGVNGSHSGAAQSADSQPSSGQNSETHLAAGHLNLPSLGDVEPISSSDPDVDKRITQEINDAPARIVAIDRHGGLSRILSGLGLRGNVVGKSSSGTEPGLDGVPVLTRHGHDLDVESTAELRPDLVIVDKPGAKPDSVQQLRAIGIRVEEVDLQRRWDSVKDNIKEVAARVGTPTAGEELAQRTGQQMDQARADVERLIPARQPRMAFLFLRGGGDVFLMMGRGTGADEVISALGGEDVIAAQGIRGSRPATPEALARANPEVILTVSRGLESSGGVDELLSRPGVAETEAGKKGRIVALPDSEAMAFGPQSGLALSQWAEALYLPAGA